MAAGGWSFEDFDFSNEPPFRLCEKPDAKSGKQSPELEMQRLLEDRDQDRNPLEVPEPSTQEDVTQLLSSLRQDQVQLLEMRGGSLKACSTVEKGFKGRCKLHLASVPSTDSAVLGDALLFCLEDSVGFGTAAEPESSSRRFRAWTKGVEEAAQQRKDLLVLTEEDGSLGFAQSIEVFFLEASGMGFQSMRAKSFLRQARPLVQAAYYEEAARCEELLPLGQHGLLLQQRLGGATALHVFAERGQAKLVARALAHGKTALEQPDFKGATPLHAASTTGQEEVVQVLLDKSASVEKVKSDGSTALLQASLNGHEGALQQLLAAKADVNLGRRTGETPLFMATAFGHRNIVRALLAANALVDKARNEGETPVAAASEMGHESTLRLLLGARAAVDASRNDGVTPVFMASLKGHAAALHVLLEMKADMDRASLGGASPLLVAAQQGHHIALRLLLQARAALNRPRADGATPLSVASQQGHEAAMRLLINGRASVDAAADSGETPLHVASRRGHEEVVQLLLEARANAECKLEGETPRSIASSSGHLNVAAKLAAAEKRKGGCCVVT